MKYIALIFGGLAASVFLLPYAAAQSNFAIQQERLLEEAKSQLAKDPADADAIIWVGRRLGYLGRYEEAISAYQEGETLHPQDARFARHIGHRLISLKRYEQAEAAFERAVRISAAQPDLVEPDGLPNDAGIPTSTLKGNIWYHLGLARYLQGDFAGAAIAYEGASALAHNPDAASAARYWLYLSLKRSGQDETAAEALRGVDESWHLIENGVYHSLSLCLRGDKDCESILAQASDSEGVVYATPAYGVAMARLLDGDAPGAKELLKEIAAKDTGASFGRLAAEAELMRLN